jgi:HSP20 family protein
MLLVFFGKEVGPMAAIAVRKEAETPLAPLWEPRWDPFRVIRDMVDWDPFAEMTPYVPPPEGFIPSFEVKETQEGFLFKADVPGVKDGDIEVTVTGNRLAIAGKREAEKEENTDTYYAYERNYGNFTRIFTLPEGVDMESVHADLKDGVLTLELKKLPERQPKKIPIVSDLKKS